MTTSHSNGIPIILKATCIEYVERKPTEAERILNPDADYFDIKHLKISIDLAEVAFVKESNDIENATALISHEGRTVVIDAPYETVHDAWAKFKVAFYSSSSEE
jgi:hypothetical protein